jgi:hypothetical protein
MDEISHLFHTRIFFYLLVKLLNNKPKMWLEKKFIDKMKFHPDKKKESRNFKMLSGQSNKNGIQMANERRTRTIFM